MKNKEIREHAWKYFELHARQRMALFNFYITISTALVAGIGVLSNSADKPIILIITLAILMIIFSVLFWLLDNRSRYFIHLAERVIRKIERDYPKKSFRIITIQEYESDNMPIVFRYTFALRTIFTLFMILGVISILYTLFIIIPGG